MKEENKTQYLIIDFLVFKSEVQCNIRSFRRKVFLNLTLHVIEEFVFFLLFTLISS